FEIIFYADNPYTNNEEDYLRLSVWSFRGKTKSILNNYLRDMTTNYKTSLLLPHDYEIPTFNYPQYVLPPVPYNYPEYTKDIMPSNVVLPLLTKITAPAQCRKVNTTLYLDVNLFSNEFNESYYETEIDLKQIDPTIQSIDKFISSYKTIEISNLNNLQVECGPPEIENFIPNKNVNITFGGVSGCTNKNPLSSIKLLESGRSQTDKVNFDNTITLYTDNIRVNDIKTFSTAYTNGLPSYDDYFNKYISKNELTIRVSFTLKSTKLFNSDKDEIKKTELQAYYTNDMKLKIRFTKLIHAELILGADSYLSFGNDKDIVLDVYNPNVLGIRNKSNNPVKITFKPR
ncbi:hypothetical protein D6D54_08890, partial [Spiroplasma poulsonii]